MSNERLDLGIGAATAAFPTDRASVSLPRPGPRLVRMAPESGIQFLSLEIPSAELALTQLSFFEHTYNVRGDARPVLMPIDPPASSDGIVWHPVSHRALSPDEIISLTGFSALEAFAGRWVPLPMFRLIGRPATAAVTSYDSGPENWARVMIVGSPGDLRTGDAVRLVLALDTRLDSADRGPDGRYLAPTPTDVRLGATFALAATTQAAAQFAARPWMDAWLRRSLAAFYAGKPDAQPPRGFSLEHVARYVALVDVLARQCEVPALRFLDTLGTRWTMPTGSVDLVLDVGPGETTALLVEPEAAARETRSSPARPLPMRDLGDPSRISAGSIATRVEFAPQPFGDAGLSRLSGRSDAFLWPSLVRIGPEAERLALAAAATPGVTGESELFLTMPEKALSDEVWRTAMDGDDPAAVGPVVSGSLLALLAADGSPIGAGERGPPTAAVRPRFSRASLLTFFHVELLLQALSAINAPQPGDTSPDELVVRALKRIVVTAPSAMPDGEREALGATIEQAVDLVWRAQGWDGAIERGAPSRPEVEMGAGSDIAAQLFHLRREVRTRFGDDLGLLQLVAARPAADGAKRMFRIASVDFGDRHTSALLVDYGEQSAGVFGPTAVTSDRWTQGEADVVGEVERRLVLPALVHALHDAGIAAAPVFLAGALDRDTTRPAAERYLARRLSAKIIRPAGRALMAIAATLPARTSGGMRVFTLAELVERGGGRLAPHGALLEQLAVREGAHGFTLADVEITFSQRQLQSIIVSCLAPAVARIARLTAEHDPDLVLLSGPLVDLPFVAEEVVGHLALSPDRIVVLPPTRAATTGRGRGTSGALDAARVAGMTAVYLADARHDAIGAPSSLSVRLGGPRSAGVDALADGSRLAGNAGDLLGVTEL